MSTEGNDLNASLRAAMNTRDDLIEIDLLSDDHLRTVAPDIVADKERSQSLFNLRDLQKEHDEIFSDYFREKQELEERYEKRFSPIFVKRKEVLDKSKLDDFWFKVFENCEVLRENITEKDALALSYLIDVSCDTVTKEKFVDGPHALPVGSFTIRLKFRDNPFFENDVLSKTYIMEEDDFEELAEARGCKVLWKPGKDLTVRTLRKKTKNGRILVKQQPTDSFFNFFNPPQGLVDTDGEVDPSLQEELEDVMDADYELGQCIRADLIPRALLYYLNLAETEADDDDDEVEQEREEDDDEDEEEDDRDDNDEDEASSNGDDDSTTRPNGAVQLPPAAKTPEECKQQ